MLEMKRSSLVAVILVVGVLLCISGPARAQGITKLRPETVTAFDAYVKDSERLLQKFQSEGAVHTGRFQRGIENFL